MQARIIPVFVRYVPEQLQEGTLYISEEFGTAVHKCCCGCGEEVVTPINPTDWSLTIKRGRVSLYPSIGNWSYTCKSHYWITGNQVIRAKTMSPREIEFGRFKDRAFKKVFFSEQNKKRGKPARSWIMDKANRQPITKFLHTIKRRLRVWWNS